MRTRNLRFPIKTLLSVGDERKSGWISVKTHRRQSAPARWRNLPLASASPPASSPEDHRDKTPLGLTPDGVLGIGFARLRAPILLARSNCHLVTAQKARHE